MPSAAATLNSNSINQVAEYNGYVAVAKMGRNKQMWKKLQLG
jgi:hypothetical protein